MEIDKKIKNYNIDYGYTTFLALFLNLRYNEGKEISIKTLKKYPEALIDLLNQNLQSIYITMINEEDNFENFLDLNKEIIKVNNDKLSLNKNISLNDLLKILNTYNYPFTDLAIDIIKNTNSIKETLGLTGIESIILKVKTVENVLEQYYNLNALGAKFDNEDKRKIKILMEQRNSFYGNLLGSSSTTLIDFEDEANQLLENPYTNNYPIDFENDYDTLFENEIYTTDDVLANPYIIACFTDYPLSMFRISEDISNLSFKYCCLGNYSNEKEYKKNIISDIISNALVNGKYIYTVRSKIEQLFMLSLIKNIDDINIKNDDEDTYNLLKLSKYRLLYLLDDTYLDLIDNNNLNTYYNLLLDEYNKTGFLNNDLFEEESTQLLEQFGLLAKIFIYDIFEGLYDEALNKKKLAFIKTYYSLTNDKEILSILNKYCDENNFWEYSSYIRKNNLKLIKK